ncbi:uncharacterized protein LOC120008749 [Tripterygium wilfordii]|uniref:uncharacterized protein LOC120008749 n=1 Tax=Tripterygium wilfordii TaxID=458696 RepID=UPI0018F85B36|nr:uncharacterized protein LOC120008749 [Tripterygium wilfordii]
MVKRIMVDQGSSVEIMYYSLFQKLGKTQADLIPVLSHLIGLNATSVWPLGRIRMPVTAGPVMVEVDFLVIDLPSTYNAILGRTWLHMLEAVPSSYHQMQKFPYEDNVVEIRGDPLHQNNTSWQKSRVDPELATHKLNVKLGNKINSSTYNGSGPGG